MSDQEDPQDPNLLPDNPGDPEPVADPEPAIGTFKYILQEVWKLVTLLPRIILELLGAVLHIGDTTDVEGTIENIREGVGIKGYNIWILVCSAILACIGLDTNSDAVIIGAMLISPLMSPILGIGLSVGINDRETLKASSKNFLIAVGASLLTATLYFLITPLGEVTDQLAARTQPTLLDIGIAFFGGVAGIVAGSRKDITNAIPGVAIATALMPPVCTAGFGLATGNFKFFGGAIYLFFLNAVFITLATYLIVRFLKFPYQEHLDRKTKRKVTRYVLLTVVLISVPSFFLLIQVVKQQRFQNNLEGFIEEVFPESENDRRMMKYAYVPTGVKDSMNLNITYAGKQYPDSLVDSLEQVLRARKVKNTNINLAKIDVDPSRFDDLKLQMHDESIAAAQLAKSELRAEMEERMAKLEEELKAVKAEEASFPEVSQMLKQGFPEIKQIALSPAVEDFDTLPDSIPTVFLSWNTKLKKAERKELIDRISAILKKEMSVDSVQVYEF